MKKDETNEKERKRGVERANKVQGRETKRKQEGKEWKIKYQSGSQKGIDVSRPGLCVKKRAVWQAILWEGRRTVRPALLYHTHTQPAILVSVSRLGILLRTVASNTTDCM
jgi:hypothetical protein